MSIQNLNENTSIPLKIVIPIVLAIIGGTWALAFQSIGMNAQLKEINAQLYLMNDKIGSSWTVKDMGLWVTKLQRNIPGVKIPDASEGLK